MRTLPPAWAAHAARNLPRYTSYPTAVDFQALDEDGPQRRETLGWAAELDADQALSAYVHTPFCRRLCWYCGCNTSVFHEYDRVAAFHDVLMREVDLWAEALGPHAGLSHLHFGGGSPNALSPAHFTALVQRLCTRLGLRPGAEVAAELDPGLLTDAFITATGEAGVTRVSLGVQTFDPEVQARINRIQPFDQVERVVERLRAAGIGAINFDLMYGLPGQTPESTAASAEAAAALAPDRLAVFGYAHVPWMKKHQKMIDEAALADASGRWAQAQAADDALTAAGYVRIGLDHYARPDDPLARAARTGTLRRNFQGYTDDAAPVMIPVGPSAIGRFPGGFVQNATPLDAWRRAVLAGRPPLARRLAVTAEDELRAAVIERLMCDLEADVGALCIAHGFDVAALDGALAEAAALQADGLCRVEGRVVRIPAGAWRMMRVTAACFDARSTAAATRHAMAV